MIDIVIVNWNSGTQLSECISSVQKCCDDVVGSIVVIDNASTDASMKSIDELASVTVIHAGGNLGFSAACNIGAAVGSCPYLLFLNPDTRVTAESLTAPLDFMAKSENSSVGICGIQLIDEDNKVSRTCARFPKFWRLALETLGVDKIFGMHHAGMQMREWSHANTQRVDQVMGAFFFVRRKLFEANGGFDERFFLYFDEVDFAYRAWSSGWQSWYLANARAFHNGGGTSKQVKAKRLFYLLRSRLLYSFKHFPRWQAWMLVALTALIEPITRLSWCLFRGDRSGVHHTILAYWILWRSLSLIVRGDGRFDPETL